MRRSKALLTVLLSLSVLVGSCSDDESVDAGNGSGVEVPDRDPDLVGTITAVTPFVPITKDCIPPDDVDSDGTVSNDDPPVCTPKDNDVLGSIRVEAEVTPETGRKISYTVTTHATITGSADGTAVAAFADLAVGQTADTWAAGPCAESYPEQCSLEAIRVTG